MSFALFGVKFVVIYDQVKGVIPWRITNIFVGVYLPGAVPRNRGSMHARVAWRTRGFELEPGLAAAVLRRPADAHTATHQSCRNTRVWT